MAETCREQRVHVVAMVDREGGERQQHGLPGVSQNSRAGVSQCVTMDRERMRLHVCREAACRAWGQTGRSS